MNRTIARFVRGFFVFLEGKAINTAVLHGWHDDFENELSDVDFVISPEGFRDFVPLVHEWCQLQGWRLCQVLRHETVATYCVCAGTDPDFVVALDACSDYQRNGIRYLTHQELLANRIRLPWGGYRVGESVEICYRFAKAAAKHKNAEVATREFLRYSADARSRCEECLLDHYGLVLGGWDVKTVRRTMKALVKRRGTNKLRMLSGLLYKIVRKTARPDGLLVTMKGFWNPGLARELARRCGHLYFRRTVVEAHVRPSHAVALLRTTMIVVERMRPVERWLVFKACVFDLDPAWSVDECFANLVSALHQRCLKREKLDQGVMAPDRAHHG